ncbi:MAG TPA: hypothetical protein VFW17_18280 [Ktedonobacterales bacterium]|nr:hypothetical protein [Ktedonobacterales bacterium]
MSLHQPRSFWPRVVCSLAALLTVLFAAGCDSSTVAPAKALTWQKRSLPITVQSFVWVFSLDNSESIWLCQPKGSTTQVWVSNDQAQHWQRASDVKDAQYHYHCAVTPDAVDPKTAIITTFYGHEPNTPNTWVITHDEGKTWQSFESPLSIQSLPKSLATINGTTYVFYQDIGDPLHNSALVASSDGLRTWHRLDKHPPTQDPISGRVSGRVVDHFWVNPETGQLLTSTADFTDVYRKWTVELETSDDGGKTWDMLPLSTSSSPPTTHAFMVQTPSAARAWTICDMQSPNDNTSLSTVVCTRDGGKTWAKIKRATGFNPQDIGIANDGSLLELTYDTKPYYPKSIQRLAPGKTAWESLGPLPRNVFAVGGSIRFQYQPGNDTGYLWLLPSFQPGLHPQDIQDIYVASYA